MRWCSGWCSRASLEWRSAYPCVLLMSALNSTVLEQTLHRREGAAPTPPHSYPLPHPALPLPTHTRAIPA